MRWSPLLAALALLLAGCTASQDAATGQYVEASETQGILRGVVVNTAIQPLEGVGILVDGKPATATRANGAFDAALEAGTHIVTAEAEGYLPQQAIVAVVAGATQQVKLVLERRQADAAYHQTLSFRGYHELSAGVATTLAHQALNTTGLPTCTCSFPFSAEPGLRAILIEATWDDSVAPVGYGATQYTWVLRAGNQTTSGKMPDPLRKEVQELDFGEEFSFSQQSSYTLSLYPDTLWPAFEQSEQVFVTLWYYSRPPTTWSILNGDT